MAEFDNIADFTVYFPSEARMAMLEAPNTLNTPDDVLKVWSPAVAKFVQRMERPSNATFAFPLFKLPLELRTIIYKYYLEADSLDAMTNAEYAAEMAKRNNDKWQTEREDPRFYMPWKVHIYDGGRFQRVDGEAAELAGPMPARYVRCFPALWHVSSQVRAEAMDAHVRDRVLLNFADYPGESSWEAWMAFKALEGDSCPWTGEMRVLHLLVDYKLVAHGESARKIASHGKWDHMGWKWASEYEDGCQCRRVMHSTNSCTKHDALFKLEVRNEGKTIRISSFCKLVDWQMTILNEQVEFYQSVYARTDKFNGNYLLWLADIIKRTEPDIERCEQVEFHEQDCMMRRIVRPYDRDWAIEATEENTETVTQMGEYMEREGTQMVSHQKLQTSYRLKNGYETDELCRLAQGGGPSAVKYDHVIAEIHVRGRATDEYEEGEYEEGEDDEYVPVDALG